MPGSCKSVAGSTGGRNSAAGQPASIISCSNAPELSNNIIQKRLAFDRDWSGTVAHSRAERRPEILPRRLHGRRGASVVRRDAAVNRTEDLNVKGCEEIITCLDNFLLLPQSPRCGS